MTKPFLQVLTAWSGAILAVVLVCATAPAAGNSPAPAPAATATTNSPTTIAPDTTPTVDKVQAKIKQIEAHTDLDQALADKVLELYKQALARLEAAEKNTANAQLYRQAIESSASQRQQFTEQLSATETPPALALPPDATAKGLEQKLLAEQAELTSLKSQITDLDQQLKTQQDRPDKARQQLAEAKQKLAGIENELTAPPPAGEDALVAEARRVWQEARKLARTTEMSMLDQELLGHSARLELLAIRRDIVARLAAQSQDRIDAIQELVNKQRRVEADHARIEAEQARRAAAGKHATVRSLAEHNAALGKELSDVTAQIEKCLAAQEVVARQLEQIEQDFKGAQRRLEVAGLSNTLGQILHRDRTQLPNMRRYRRDSARRRNEISRLGLRELTVQEARRAIGDTDKQTQQIMTTHVDVSLPAQVRAEIEAQVRKLLEDQQVLFDKLADAYARHLKQLGDLDFDQQQLIATAQAYAGFLDQRLLWIRSTVPVGSDTLKKLQAAALWLSNPGQWRDVWVTLSTDVVGSPVLASLSVLVFAAMVITRRRAHRHLKALGTRVGNIYTDSFALTARALLTTLWMAAPIPLLMGVVAWRLLRPANESDFAKAIGAGLANASGTMFVLQSLWLMCMPGALAEIHLRWRSGAITLLRRNLLWLTAVALPAIFFVAVTEWHHNDAYRQSLGRLAFMTGMGALSLFVAMILRPPGGIAEQTIRLKPHGWLSRLRYVWYPTGVGLPLVLAGLAASGYYYTALQLSSRLLASVWLLVSLVVAHELIMRWLFVTYAKLAVAKSRQKHQASRSPACSPASTEARGQSPPVDEFPDIDMSSVSEHTQHLLRVLVNVFLVVGLWLIWADIIPAFQILDTLSLWHYPVVIDGQETLQPVTLADLGLAIVAGILAAVAARHVPGVLEIALLQHLPLDAGSRYAIRSIVRYTMIAIGVIVTFTLLGVGWSRIQWLVAALSVGLGFGLQEIVANFVSGLIILFERPIRIGDTVTVGDISGTVARIQIRATTITDWDRKELIIPNKMFITDRLINWTLSDPITRLIVKVGIAYGSDTELAQKLMLEVATSNRSVMADPQPTVLFLGFGESSLDFEVRAFVTEVTNRGRAQIAHELHMGIDQAFRKHGVVIAFPQRDVHLYQGQPPAPAANATPESDGPPQPVA